MELSRELKTAIKTGDLTFGQNQASDAWFCPNVKFPVLIAVFSCLLKSILIPPYSTIASHG